jgi:hypothetical protein
MKELSLQYYKSEGSAPLIPSPPRNMIPSRFHLPHLTTYFRKIRFKVAPLSETFNWVDIIKFFCIPYDPNLTTSPPQNSLLGFTILTVISDQNKYTSKVKRGRK